MMRSTRFGIRRTAPANPAMTMAATGPRYHKRVPATNIMEPPTAPTSAAVPKSTSPAMATSTMPTMSPG